MIDVASYLTFAAGMFVVFIVAVRRIERDAHARGYTEGVKTEHDEWIGVCNALGITIVDVRHEADNVAAVAIQRRPIRTTQHGDGTVTCEPVGTRRIPPNTGNR